MSKRDIKFLLEDMLESALKIKRYTTNLDYDSFVNDDKTIDAVVRNFEIIGEASKMISEDTKTFYPMIEWREMTDFRNVLIHNYFGIDYTILWDAINNMLPFNYEMLKRVI